MAVSSIMSSLLAGSTSAAPIRLLARMLATENAVDVVKEEEPGRLVAPPDTLASTWITPEARLLSKGRGGRRGSPRTARCRSCHRDSVTVTYCPPGQRLDPRTVPFPRANTAWEDWIAVAAMSIMFTVPFICLACLLLAPAALLYACTQMYVYHQHSMFTTICLFFSAFVSTCFLICCCIGDGEVKMSFRHHYIFDCVRRHYQLRCIAPPLPYTDPKRRYLLAQFPHAVFPIAVWLNAATVGLPASGFPHPMRCAIADVLLKLPLFKIIFQWMGCVSAEKGPLLKLLQQESVGIIPEGVAGILEGASPDVERLYINHRKGFVRVAIQAGAGIVPIYHLGNSQLMRFYGLNHSSRKARAALGWFAGRWGLPIPKRYPIVSLVGAPIEVVQCDNPSQEYVDEIHGKVVKALVDNYNLHRHLLPGWEDKPLHLA